MSHSNFALFSIALLRSARCNRLPLLTIALAFSAQLAFAAWTPGTRFEIREHNGQPQLFDPNGNPFKSVGMVWDYGPHRGDQATELTADRVIETLRLLKDLGFNTLNLYGDKFMPEMLDWCDRNEFAVYFRTDHHQEDPSEGGMAEYPDYIDPAFRAKAKKYYDDRYLDVIKHHPSVLAIDMDHDWLFPLDWSSAVRFDLPKIRRHGRDFFPRWLAIRYGTVEKLNHEFGTAYATFDAILEDDRLVKNSRFQPLKNHPLRVPVYEYTVWTSQDFITELARHMKAKVPGLMVTPTTEHPEVLPDFNPPPSTGVDFMSPVHYNLEADFERDQAALCKLIYETRWHYDMQGAPVYISETGWRTEILEQEPPSIAYAWSVPQDEEVVARLYAEQFTLMNVLPWISGYGYFKLFDKWEEGDFGYLRDDGSKKPMAKVGDVINGAFADEALPDPEPTLWIYYPDYAKATHKPGYQQLKTLIYMLQKPFLDALDERIDENWKALISGDKGVSASFAAGVADDFRKMWRGFAFTSVMPEDDKPIVLLSSVSEILSPPDRLNLLAKKTISFGPVGVRDVAMRETAPWNFEAIGLDAGQVRETLRLYDFGQKRFGKVGEAVDTAMLALQAGMRTYDHAPLACDGQNVKIGGAAKRALFLASSSGGNAALPIQINYRDDTSEQLILGPTISDERFTPTLTRYITHQGKSLSLLDVRLDSGMEISSIELPVAPWVKLYAAVFVSGGEEQDALIKLGKKGEEVVGTTPWRIAFPSKSVKRLNVIAATRDGSPAVVSSGGHASYLFDPLTWAGEKNELSRHVGYHAVMFDSVLKQVEGE